MRIFRRMVWAGVLVGAELAAMVALHRLGRLPWLAIDTGDLAGWLATTAPEDAIAAVLRLVALGCAGWLLASTLLYTAARASRVPRAIAAVEWATLPAVRRTVDRSLALALSAGAAVGLPGPPARAAALSPAPAPVAAVAGASTAPGATTVVTPPAFVSPEALPSSAPATVVVPPAFVSPEALPPPERAAGPLPVAGPEPEPRSQAPADPQPSPAPAPDPRPVAPPPPAGVEGQQVHRVAPGENLWEIAANRLAVGSGGSASDLPLSRVHAYWTRVLAANQATLRSGDPDVIYPGEVIVLPAP